MFLVKNSKPFEKKSSTLFEVYFVRLWHKIFFSHFQIPEPKISFGCYQAVGFLWSKAEKKNNVDTDPWNFSTW